MVRIIQQKNLVRNPFRFVLMMMCIAVFPVLIGCGGSPEPGDATGGWEGTISEVAGAGEFAFDMFQGIFRRDADSFEGVNFYSTFESLDAARGYYNDETVVGNFAFDIP